MPLTAENAKDAEQNRIVTQGRLQPNTETGNSPRALRPLRFKPSRLARAATTRVAEPEMLRPNHCLTLAEDQRPFDHVLQFADVPAPGLSFEHLQRFRRQFRPGLVRDIFPDKVQGQLPNVFGPVA